MKKLIILLLITVFQFILVFFLVNIPYYNELKTIKRNINKNEILMNNVKRFSVIKGIEINNLLDDNQNLMIGIKENLKAKDMSKIRTKKLIRVTIYYKRNIVFLPLWFIIFIVNILL
ncbi:hypothetical protein J7L48_03425, partial [bacterium]|nr:hypothetical protein [bacterium]